MNPVPAGSSSGDCGSNTTEECNINLLCSTQDSVWCVILFLCACDCYSVASMGVSDYRCLFASGRKLPICKVCLF